MWWTGSVKGLVQMSNQRLQSAIADATELPVFPPTSFCVLLRLWLIGSFPCCFVVSGQAGVGNIL